MSTDSGISRRRLLGILCASGTAGCTQLEQTLLPCTFSWKDGDGFTIEEDITGYSMGAGICGPDDEYRCLRMGLELTPGTATRLEARWPDGTVAAKAPVKEDGSVDVEITNLDPEEVYDVKFVLLDGSEVVDQAAAVYDCN